MQFKRYSVEQVVAALKQHEPGMPVADIARRLGVAEQTFYRWKKQYGGLEPGEVRAFKPLRGEHTRLKRRVADLSLDKVMLQDIASKKMVGASQRRLAVRHLQPCYSVSERRSCEVTGMPRSTRRCARPRLRYGRRSVIWHAVEYAMATGASTCC